MRLPQLLTSRRSMQTKSIGTDLHACLTHTAVCFVHFFDGTSDSDRYVLKVAVRGEDVVDSVGRYRYVIKKFQPDISIFFIRHPVDNWASLDKHIRSTTNRNKPDKCQGNTALAIGYGWRCGTPNGKLTALEHLYRVHNEPRDESRGTNLNDRESGGLFDLIVRPRLSYCSTLNSSLRPPVLFCTSGSLS